MALSRRRARMLGRLKSRRFRPREGRVLVEGVRTVEEALDAGAEAEFAVVSPVLDRSSPGRALRSRIAGSGIEVEEMEDEELAAHADTEAHQGVLLVCREPSWDLEKVLQVRAGTDGRFLVLDAVQDPGNVGTLVRSAWAFALGGVIALDGSVDPWNPKVVRSSAGATFRLPLLKATWPEVEEIMDRAGIEVLVAHPAGEDVSGVRLGGSWALVIGNEGAGPRPEVLNRGGRRVRVPMPGGAESLNAGVAGSILLYALTPEGGWS